MSRRALTTVVLLLIAGCAPAPADDLRAAAADGATPSGVLVVQAAASLVDAFAEIATDVEAIHPGLDVILNTAGSQILAAQVRQGAPADVIATADPAPLRALAQEGLLAGAPRVMARNALAIAVEPGNPLDIGGLTDLGRADVVVVLAAPDVPAGALAARALAAAGVTIAPASLELDVRAVLGRVVLGEADAGLVYRTDVVAADGDVEAVDVPVALSGTAEYPIAVLDAAPNPAAADAFVAHVLGERGQAVLDAHGFLR